MTRANNPFLKGNAEEETLGANSQVRVKKQQLDHLINSLKENKAELQSLNSLVEQNKTVSNSSFVAMNKSLVFKHDYLRDKPFILTLHQIKQLASTPVGYGLHMLEIFDLTENQLKQQKQAAQERIDMYNSIMMQSQMPMDASAIGASMMRPPPFTGGGGGAGL